jgi:hypothetical protein
VVPAAAFGRVEVLFVVLDERLPGVFDQKKNQVTVTTDGDPASGDLLDLAVVETVKNGGRIHAVKKERMPEEHAAVAAILRY